MKIIESHESMRIKYDSLRDFFTHTSKDSKIITHYDENTSLINDILTGENNSWRFGEESTRTEFYKTRFNPDKGKKLCAKSVKSVLEEKSYKSLIKNALTYKKRVSYKDSGFRLNIPKAISGEDKYFIHYSNSKKPTVKIAINICGSACVRDKDFIEVAKAAVPTIYALEMAGIATEVWYCAFVTNPFTKRKDVATEVLIKSSQQRFNWTTFAPVFTLGTYRENIFMSWCNQDRYETDSGLGRPMDDKTIQKYNNYGYTSIIGLNAPGPVNIVNSIFEKIKH